MKTLGRGAVSNKKSKSLFFRSFWITLLLLGSVSGSILGMAVADQNSRAVGFAEKQPTLSVEYQEGRLFLRFFGYEAEWEVPSPSPPRRMMHPEGQTSTQAPQPVHCLASTRARLSVTWMAPSGQALAHFIQPMHPAEHSFRVTPPFSLLWHTT